MGNIFGTQSQEAPPYEPPRQATYQDFTPIHRNRPPPAGIVDRTTPICALYTSGVCTRGATCRFSHCGPVYPIGMSVPKPKKPCYFFAKGHCKKGVACNFSHDQQKEEDKGPNDDDSVDDWARELGGAWAQFGDGATVSKVSLPSDFSAIRISNLPLNGSVRFVRSLLSDVGIVISGDEVRLMKHPDNRCSTAIVKAEDPAFANTACRRLKTCVTIENLQVVPIPAPMPKGSNFRQVDCRQVHCSWHRPSRTACLEFGTKKIASRVHKSFRTGQYKVSGSTFTANPPVARGSQQGGWIVKLTGLAENTVEQDIIQGIPGFDKPRSVELSGASYAADMEMDSTIIKSMLYEFGPLERWDLSDSSKGRRINARATFVDESHARDAASSLDKKTLPFCETGKLFVNLVTSVKFKVSTRVYNVIQKRINNHKASWERQYIRFFAFPPRGFHRILKLEGEDRQKVAQAQKDLEHIVTGEVMRKDGKNIWYADFRPSGDAYKRLAKIEEDLGIVITREVRSSQFRVFGPEERYSLAVEGLHQLIQDMTSATHYVQLDHESELEWALDGGFKVLESQLGHGKAILDIRSRCIIVHGSDQDFSEAKLIMARRQTKVIKRISNPQTDCTICWGEAEQPIRTSCNHVYCSLCFVNMCQHEADASKSTDFRISCEGDLGKCGNAFQLSEIQSLLLSETFEDILGASFASHVRRHPDEFRYCPTPDCTQIYRVASHAVVSPPTFTCVKCLASTCTGCHVPHPGVTCAEHKGDASGGLEALNKAKEELGIKDCPKCSTAIEKIDGCNHIGCTGCGIHICWVCLATFQDGQACYAHMQRVHGGMYT